MIRDTTVMEVGNAVLEQRIFEIRIAVQNRVFMTLGEISPSSQGRMMKLRWCAKNAKRSIYLPPPSSLSRSRREAFDESGYCSNFPSSFFEDETYSSQDQCHNSLPSRV